MKEKSNATLRRAASLRCRTDAAITRLGNALYPADNADRAVDLFNGALLKFRQSAAGQLTFQTDEPAFIAADNVGNSSAAVRPAVFLPKENGISQCKEIPFDRSHNISFEHTTSPPESVL